MNSSNPQLPQSPPVQPIHDVAPRTDSLGNPENLANIPVHQAPGEQPPANPPAADQVQAVAPAQSQAEDIDKVLKDVNKDVKAEDKPKKVQKPSSNKPILVITMAVIVGLALSAAAYYAYNSAN